MANLTHEIRSDDTGAAARQMQIGLTGTPSTWCASRPAKNCRSKLTHERKKYGRSKG